jgi:Helix-turn-helix domain, rpiR family
MGEPFQRERPKKDFPQDYAAHDIIGYLLDNAGELSKAHGKIADAILYHPTMFVEKPIEDLVTWLGVSAPTITRFSRAIGCEGLRDLKLKVMSSMRVGMRYLEPLTPPDTLAEVQERVVLRAQRAVLAAQKTIDVVMLDRVIDALTRSHTIYAFGSGGVSSWMVEEIHNRLFRLGLRITSSSDHQMQMMLAATVERGDVVFCSSLEFGLGSGYKEVMADPDVVASFSKWRDVDTSNKQLQLATSRKIAKTIWFPEWDLFMMQHVQDYIRGNGSTDQLVAQLSGKVGELKKQYQ